MSMSLYEVIVIMVLLIALWMALAPSPWVAVSEKVAKSVVGVDSDTDGKKSYCTGFVVDSEKDLVVTAGHCEGKVMRVDGSPAAVLWSDERKDLLVLVVKDLDKPALALAKQGPETGDEVASVGFGYGLNQPIFRQHYVSATGLVIEIPGYGGPFYGFDCAFAGGNSCSPVVNL